MECIITLFISDLRLTSVLGLTVWGYEGVRVRHKRAAPPGDSDVGSDDNSERAYPYELEKR